MSGIAGAFAATVALFGPGVLLMLLISRQYDRFRADIRMRYFFAGVNPAVVSLVLSSAYSLGRNTILSWHAYLLLALSFVLLAAFQWHPAFVLALSAVVGYLRLIQQSW